MQCQEREERRRKRFSNKGADGTQQEDAIDSRMMNELARVLQSGTINDFVPVLESEQVKIMHDSNSNAANSGLIAWLFSIGFRRPVVMIFP